MRGVLEQCNAISGVGVIGFWLQSVGYRGDWFVAESVCVCVCVCTSRKCYVYARQRMNNKQSYAGCNDSHEWGTVRACVCVCVPYLQRAWTD